MTTLDLAAIGNCAIAALIDRKGDLVWSCFPRLDGEPVFCGLLDGLAEEDTARDKRSGVFSIRLLGWRAAELHREHRRSASTMSDAHGNSIEITDFAPRFSSSSDVPLPVLIRRALLHGCLRITARIKPLFGWGATAGNARQQPCPLCGAGTNAAPHHRCASVLHPR
jgi:hypothetical protein